MSGPESPIVAPTWGIGANSQTAGSHGSTVDSGQGRVYPASGKGAAGLA